MYYTVTLAHRALADVETMEKLFTSRMSLQLEIPSQQERTWSLAISEGAEAEGNKTFSQLGNPNIAVLQAKRSGS